MINSIKVLVILGATLALGTTQSFDDTEIHGYHFHTYFFQTDDANINEAKSFREAIQAQINAGPMKNCRLNRFNEGPVGPHPIGSYETCCNKTSISEAMSWFMLNHGNLTILLHPLTRWEMVDHTDRVMFFGDSHKIKLSALNEDLEDHLDLCLPLLEEDTGDGGSISISPVPFLYSLVILFSVKIISLL
ncbi:unnamed protein product [Allacma fusca]|uniref:DOPA 4,5-dioxygenase n=1 Tax=Allacma fusca TaxID=39272 RepID=A0A8J2P5T1_9HEXA|nr:unnamed protein product [Allacma fusca]